MCAYMCNADTFRREATSRRRLLLPNEMGDVVGGGAEPLEQGVSIFTPSFRFSSPLVILPPPPTLIVLFRFPPFFCVTWGSLCFDLVSIFFRENSVVSDLLG